MVTLPQVTVPCSFVCCEDAEDEEEEGKGGIDEALAARCSDSRLGIEAYKTESK